MTDEVLGGELAPERREERRIGDLKPIPEQVKPECRELARSLRELFGAVGVSLRVFAVRVHYDAGTVSRYLNGTVVPPAEFVNQLLKQAAEATGRASSAEVMAHVHALQRRALQVTNKVGWELQRLRDQLADADRQRQQAEVRAEALSEALLVRQQRIAEMEVEQRQIAVSASMERDEREAEVDRLRGEHEGLRTERDRLREEVARLQGELTQARRQALEAERRCEALEHQLQTEEEAAGAKAEAEDPAEHRLQLAHAWARQLERELMELRAREGGAVPGGDSDEGQVVARDSSGVMVQAGSDRLRQPITITYAGAHRPWAAWAAHWLEAAGAHEVTIRCWQPSDQDLFIADRGQVLLLSEHFEDAWHAALGATLSDQPFVAFTIADRTPPRLATRLGAVDLRGLDEAEAGRRLLRGLGLPAELLAFAPAHARQGPRFPVAPPAVWDGVPRRNPRFTGRDALLVAVHDRLEAAPADTAVVALVGLPGIGKTQLAAEYAHRFAGRYDAVWWAPGDHRPTLEGRFAGLARVLGGADEDPVRSALDALRRGDPYERWLLVLDGADDPDAIADLLPAGRGHVLVTSRNRAWADHYAELLDVPPLSREESVAFVRRRAPRIGAEDADRLAAAVEDLPLPLDQTAGWLDASTTPVAEYVRMVSDGEPNPVRSAADYPMPYHSAFKDLITQLRETTKAAAELLSLCALFDPGPVPLALLRAVPADQVSPAVAALLDNPSQLDLAVGKLVQRSVVRVADDAVWMSRFVRDAVRRRTPGDRREKDARVVRGALVAADPRRPDDPAMWPRYARLVPYLESSGALTSRDTASRRLVHGFLTFLTLSGDYATGTRIAEGAAATGPDFLVSRAALLRETGDYAAAEALDRSVLGLAEPDAPGALVAMARLVTDLRGLGRYDEAYHLALRERDLCAAQCPEKGKEMRNAKRSQAGSLRMLGSYTGAAALSREALDGARAELGPTALVTLACETELAYDLRLSGCCGEAQTLQAASTDRHREVLGDDHPWTLAAAHHRWLCDVDPDVDIHGLWRKAADLLGADSPVTLRIAAGAVRALRYQDDTLGARDVGEETAVRYRATLGDQHPYAIGTRAHHALTLAPHLAVRVLEAALTDMTAAVGERHPWTLGIALNTAATYHVRGQREDACAMSREVALHAAEVLGQRHPLTLMAQIGLAADLRTLRGGQGEADVIEEVALGGLTAVLGPGHPDTVVARDRIRPVWDFEPLPI
ncbi:FxSxx-COOH system tetratricopeptide repeat protein [Streptomyces sp. Rer75]|uniref:FxSxx-COOH system tetratricopeptide repeat protein n=1 Tax=Streptomyces sp. Rer75 TaxID=2750011 RepID=UPI0015CFDA20|nr:FxSxx-COOH system tetratricopeptide repeat protein [Streptomyces sp. Rer75]QLH24081.1 ATP-binding protein [Streptomyces sp. Rer75]